MQELLNRIKNEQESFPSAQRQVASYVVNNYMQIPFLSITSIAKEIGVSDTTIIKFSTQLGFNGFGDFKKVFSDYVYSKLTMYNKVVNTDIESKAEKTSFDRIENDDITNIRETFSNEENIKKLDKLINMIYNANEVYAVGARSSAILAEYMANTLRYLGIKVQSLSGGVGDAFDRLFTAASNDLVIAFSFSRYTSFIVDALKELHERNIPIVLITDTGLSPCYPYSDLSFQCKIDSAGYFPSFTSVISLLNVICYEASCSKKNRAASHILDLEHKLLRFGVFK